MLNADWDAIADLARDLLRRLDRNETSNPHLAECLAAGIVDAGLA